MALPKSNRLSLRTSKDLFLGGKKFYSSHFTIVCHCEEPGDAAISDLKESRFAVVVSKKTARLSHDRHRIRRLTTSAIFEQINNFPVGYYLVFPKASVLNTPYAELLSDLSTITAKLKTQI